MRPAILTLSATFVLAAAAAFPASAQGPGPNPARHQYYMSRGLPDAYRGLRNPLSPTPETVEAGKNLYAVNCAVCHGAKGFGDGEGGKALNPPPADLALTMSMPMTNDAYLYWSIAGGGQVVGSAMPPFKGILKDNQIWEIITYLRQDLGAGGPHGPGRMGPGRMGPGRMGPGMMGPGMGPGRGGRMGGG